MKTVCVRERIELVYETFGSELDTPILLVPGAGAPKEFWPEFFCESLARQGFFVIRYSHRDTDFSTHLEDDYPIQEIVLDMLDFINRIIGRPLHIVGHSMGGFLVQLGVIDSPELFRSATSISSGSVIDPDQKRALGLSDMKPETWKQLSENEPGGDFDKDWNGWLDSWIILNGKLPVDEVLAKRYTKALYVGDARNSQPARKHIDCMSSIPADLPKQLKKSACPFLVIHGTDDLLIPYDNGLFTSTLPKNSCFAGLDKAGHMFFSINTWEEIRLELLRHIEAV